MKTLSRYIFFFIIVLCNSVNAQKIFSEQMFEYDTTLSLDNNIKDLYIEYFDGDSTITYIDATAFVRLNVYNGISSKVSLSKYLKTGIKKVFEYKDYLFISTNEDFEDEKEDVYIFKKEQDSLWLMKKTYLDSIYGITEIYDLPNEKLLLVDGYMGRPFEKHPYNFLKLIIFDLKTGTEVKRISPRIELPLTTFFGSGSGKMVAVTDTSILLMQKGIYKIYEYDYNLNLKDSLSNQTIKWKSYPQEKHDTILQRNEFVADYIGSMIDDVYQYSMMFDICSFKDKIIVTYNDIYYKSKNTFATKSYDIWEKVNGKWQLRINNAYDIPKEKYQGKSQYDRVSYIFNREYFFKKNKILTLRNGIPLSLNKILSMSKKEYKKLQKEYYSTHSDELFFDVYKIKF